jgi:hypothetical protein
MSPKAPNRRPARPISDGQRSMLTDMRRDVQLRQVPPQILEIYTRAEGGEPVTQREMQRIVEAFREHAKPNSELPLHDKQLWWVEKLSGEPAAEAAASLTRDQFPRLVLQGLKDTYGTDDLDEILQLPMPTVKKWSTHLVAGAALVFGSAQRERQTTLIQAAGEPHDLKAPMTRLYKDLVKAAQRDDEPADTA